MKSFLNSDRPILTGMIKGRTTDEVVAEVERLKRDGVEAFGFQLDHMDPGYKGEEDIKRIFNAMSPLPIYATNYKRSNSEPDIDWQTLEDQLVMMLALGATLIDIPADMYHTSDMELTTDEAAIEKQKQLIDKIHSLGGEVLMSSHVLRFIPKETAMFIAREQKSRGADIAKIVTSAETDAELYENFEICIMLRRELGIKSLFLCGGEKRRMHRLLGPLFGSCMYLVTENALLDTQPAVALATKALEYLG